MLDEKTKTRVGKRHGPTTILSRFSGNTQFEPKALATLKRSRMLRCNAEWVHKTPNRVHSVYAWPMGGGHADEKKAVRNVSPIRALGEKYEEGKKDAKSIASSGEGEQRKKTADALENRKPNFGTKAKG